MLILPRSPNTTTTPTPTPTHTPTPTPISTTHNHTPSRKKHLDRSCDTRWELTITQNQSLNGFCASLLVLLYITEILFLHPILFNRNTMSTNEILLFKWFSNRNTVKASDVSKIYCHSNRFSSRNTFGLWVGECVYYM